MSYILEAIRRSEEARNKRVIPAVSTVHIAPPARARASSQTLRAGLAIALAAAVVAVAVAAALAVALGPSLRPMEAAGPETPGLAAAPAGAENQRAAAPQAGAPASPLQTAEAPAQAAAATPAPAPSRGTAVTAAPARAGGEADAEAKPRRRPYSAPASDEAKPRGAPKAVAAPPQGQAAPAPAAELVTAPALRDLPAAVQRALPSIAITLHRYAPAPDARMIRVNGRAAREGDVVAGDLGVAEITRNGVVFAVGDQRFYMDAFQTWQAKGG